MSIWEYAVKASQDEWRRVGERERLLAEARHAVRDRKLRASTTARGRHHYRHQYRLLWPHRMAANPNLTPDTEASC